jgi:DNA-binding NarL/FixJ family response regulator
MSQSSSLVVVADRFRLDSELLAAHISTIALTESAAPEALAGMDLERVDLVVLDAECPDAVFQTVCADAAAVGLVYDHDSGRLRLRAAAACVRLVLPRSVGLSEWRSAVKAVLAGDAVVDLRKTGAPRPSSPSLSPREAEVLHLMAGGLGNNDIADALDISPHTVRTHVHSVLTKLNKNSRVSAVGAARKSGLLG